MPSHDIAMYYQENVQNHEELAHLVAHILRAVLDSHGICYVDIPMRIKSLSSTLQKCQNKQYQSIHEVTDLIGLRVVALVEKDLLAIENVIRANFAIDESRSSNKGNALGTNQVGYRSVHFLCTLDEQRVSLPENQRFANMHFEIQIRTALAHTWAEIEHKGNYKCNPGLPDHLKRRFGLLAGVLESADLEFNRLTDEVDRYYQALHPSLPPKTLKIAKQTSLIHAFHQQLQNMGLAIEAQQLSSIDPIWFCTQLRHFEIHNTEDLCQLFNQQDLQETLAKMEEYQQPKTLFTLLSSILMRKDPRRYLSLLSKQQLAYLLTTPKHWLYYQNLIQAPI